MESSARRAGDMRKGLLSLSPVFVFLGIYVVISLIIGDFYKIPLSVALLAATLWAMLIYRDVPLLQRVETFAREAGNSNVLYMVWIFILAGCFANLADKTGSAAATVTLTISQLPPDYVLPGLFISACLVSMAIGSSVGTVVALVPLALNFAESVNADVAFFIAVVIGGSFFGDNLSFISDTTIAATRTQGCRMSDKFKANFKIVLPAALVTLAIYMLGDFPVYSPPEAEAVNYWLVFPYVAVIVLAVSGINVTATLVCGILLSIVTSLCAGFDFLEILAFMGDGIDSMGNLIIITLMAAGMLGLIKAAGGIKYLLRILTVGIKGKRGAQGSIALLVGIVNLCTANNTVAILTVGDISRQISEKYRLEPKRSASLLDTASCIVQCLIPYGAQMLLATSMAGISPTAPWRFLYYPWILGAIVIVSILLHGNKKAAKRP